MTMREDDDNDWHEVEDFDEILDDLIYDKLIERDDPDDPDMIRITDDGRRFFELLNRYGKIGDILTKFYSKCGFDSQPTKSELPKIIDYLVSVKKLEIGDDGNYYSNVKNKQVARLIKEECKRLTYHEYAK